jgi:hypothetical protein
VWELPIRDRFAEESAQFLPLVALFPTDNQQIIMSVSKPMLHVLVMLFVVTSSLLVIGAPLAKNWLPPTRLLRFFRPNALLLLMVLQARYVSLSILAHSEDELAARVMFVQLAIDTKPWPILKAVVSVRYPKYILEIVIDDLDSQLHIVRVVPEAQCLKARTQRRRACFGTANTKNLLYVPPWQQSRALQSRICVSMIPGDL